MKFEITFLATIAAAAYCRRWLFFVSEAGRPGEATKRYYKKNNDQGATAESVH